MRSPDYIALTLVVATSISTSTRAESATQGSVGVDLSVATNTSSWSCVIDDLRASDSSLLPPFATVRVYRNIGQVDENAPATLLAAHEAGFRRFSGYVFPCIASSPFALSRDDVECPPAAQQLSDTLSFLSAGGVDVARSPAAETPAPPDASVTEQTGGAGRPTLQRLFLDIEDMSPAYYFDPDPAVNQKFVADFVATAAAEHVPVGFYTTSTYWSSIMDDISDYSEPVFPLWYPRWDATNTMEFFEPFAGWGAVAMKQTAGDVDLCGISQVDLDYMQWQWGV